MPTTGFMIKKFSSSSDVVGADPSTIVPKVTHPTVLNDVFAGDLSEFYANEVLNGVTIKGIPAPIVSYILEQVFERLRTELSTELLVQLQEFLLAEKTISNEDDFKGKDLEDIAHKISDEISSSTGIDLPFLNDEQEKNILDEVCFQILDHMFTSQKEKRKAWIRLGITTRGDILRSDESRQQLVERINMDLNIPFLNEDSEQKLLATAVDRYSKILESILPAGLIDTLTGEDPEGVAHMKEYLIGRLNGRINIPGLSEEREEELITTLIDIYLDEYVDETPGSRLMFMNENEKKEDLVERCTILQRKLRYSTSRYEREQKNINAKLQKLTKNLEQIKLD
jgi:hypothetical protein